MLDSVQVVNVTSQKASSPLHIRLSGIHQVAPVCTPSKTCFLGPTRVQPTQTILRLTQPCLHSSEQCRRACQSMQAYILSACGNLDPNTTHSMGPPESWTQLECWQLTCQFRTGQSPAWLDCRKLQLRFQRERPTDAGADWKQTIIYTKVPCCYLPSESICS